MDIMVQLARLKIKPVALKEQFFLIDEEIIKKMVSFAELNKNDVVLEIGAGIGNLTTEITKKAGKVIAFELDRQFKPFLDKLPSNVEIYYEDAWEYVKLHGKFPQKKEYNKVVSNLPYSFAEKFLHNLTFLIYDKVILLIPLSLSKKIETNPIFGSFFQVEEKLKVDKNKFYPVPKTNSVVIELKKLPDAILTKNLPLFLRQAVYQYEQNKSKNSLREGLIKYMYLTRGKRFSKNEAKRIINQSGINEALLEKPPDNPEIYQQISERFHYDET